MRTTINLDDQLLAKAARLVGPMDRTAIVHEGLRALIQRESARRLARLDRLVLQVVETDLVWEETVVYHQPNKAESLAWTLFKDGMRVLTLFPGVEEDEIVRFLDQRAPR